MWEFMKIGLAQMSMESDLEANFLKSLEYMRSAAKQDVDLICFPEVQLSPFFAQYERRNVDAYVIENTDRYIKEMCDYCRNLGIYATPNFYVEENGKRYDMSFLIDANGEIIGRQKMREMNYSFQRGACRAEALKLAHGQFMLLVVRE